MKPFRCFFFGVAAASPPPLLLTRASLKHQPRGGPERLQLILLGRRGASQPGGPVVAVASVPELGDDGGQAGLGRGQQLGGEGKGDALCFRSRLLSRRGLAPPSLPNAPALPPLPTRPSPRAWDHASPVINYDAALASSAGVPRARRRRRENVREKRENFEREKKGGVF